jgi:hypothetical protein
MKDIKDLRHFEKTVKQKTCKQNFSELTKVKLQCSLIIILKELPVFSKVKYT